MADTMTDTAHIERDRTDTARIERDLTDTARIERDLDQTRSRLGSHLGELQDRLSPGQVLDDLMGYFRGSEGAEFGRSLLENVRGNPMPAAVSAIGLTWLMASNPRQGQAVATSTAGMPNRLPIYGHDDHHATMARLTSVEQSLPRDAAEPDHAYSARLDTARGQAIGLARHSEESTDSFGERVRHAMAAIQDAVSAKAHDVQDRASASAGATSDALAGFGAAAKGSIQDAAAYTGNLLSTGGRSAGQAGGNLMAAITESPVLLGALGMAAGALLGALLPHSEQEEAALGGIARQARDTVSNLAREGMDRGSRVVTAVSEKARDGVQGQGLTGDKSAGQLVDAALSGDLAGNLKQVASDTLRAADEAVRKEGLA
jgi:hypothetical protein